MRSRWRCEVVVEGRLKLSSEVLPRANWPLLELRAGAVAHPVGTMRNAKPALTRTVNSLAVTY